MSLIQRVPNTFSGWPKGKPFQLGSRFFPDIKNSPTAKLNSKWKKVCEEEFPNLNLELMKGAAREHVQKSWEFNRNYREWCTLMQAMHG